MHEGIDTHAVQVIVFPFWCLVLHASIVFQDHIHLGWVTLLVKLVPVELVS
jgi:hypothetical protein